MNQEFGDPGRGSLSEYDPVALIEGMGFDTLHAVEAVIHGDWKSVIAQERRSREQAVVDLATYTPDVIDTPPFDRQDIPGYIAQARAVSNAGYPRRVSRRFLQEGASVQAHAEAYFGEQGVQNRLRPLLRAFDLGRAEGIGRSTDDVFSSFLADNIYGIVSPPHYIATHALDAARGPTLQAHFPQAAMGNYRSILAAAKNMPHTREHIEAARQDVERVAAETYRAPYADFFQLSADDQKAIVNTIGKEWEDLCIFIHDFDPRWLPQNSPYLVSPLAYLPADTLKRALADNPDLDPGKILTTYLWKPSLFLKRVESMRQNKQRIEQARAERQQASLARAALAAQIAAQQPERAASEPEAPKLTRRELPPTPPDLMQHDHALIVVPNHRTGEVRRFHLETNRANALLAARIAGRIAQYKPGSKVVGRELAQSVWQDMPAEERRLFTTRESDLKVIETLAIPRIIEPYFVDTMGRLLSKLGISRHTSDGVYLLERKPKVTFSRVPIPEEERARYVPLFPPGTLRERIYEAANDPLLPEVIQAAGDMLDQYFYREEAIPQSEAPQLLNFITQRNNKRGMRAQLERRHDPQHLNDVLRTLHRRIHRSLGGAYEDALRNCMIAGNSVTSDHRIYMTGGRLAIITNVSKTSSSITRPNIITRWYAGTTPL